MVHEKNHRVEIDAQLEIDVEAVVANNKLPGFFIFYSSKDIPHLTLATLLVCISAAGSPVQTVLYGNIFTKLSQFLLGKYASVGHFVKDVRFGCLLIILTGAIKALFTFLGISTWMKYGEVQQKRARTILYNATLNRKFEWLDKQENLMGELSQVNRCVEELRNGLSEEMGLLIQAIATVISLFVTAMYHSWNLTLVIMTTAPVMALLGWIFGKLTYNSSKLENNLNSEASKVLDWSLVSGDVVRAFNGKFIEIVKFNKIVNLSAKAYYRLAFAMSANSGSIKFLAFMMFVQGFWFGIHMLKSGKLHINQVFTCFSACLMLGLQFGEITSILAALQIARAAVDKIEEYSIESQTECESERGSVSPHTCPHNCLGDFKFNDVQFTYPTRPDLILKGVSFKIPLKTISFIVGESGSGKSTIAQLLMRFYNPTTGQVKVDGYDLFKLDSEWITDSFTFIQQSPTIFKTSVKKNISLLLKLDDVPEELIKDAISFSLLDDVINSLLEGSDSEIFQDKLSGGQQQRISIARAKIRNTPVLILDESLSALDVKTRDQLFERIRSWRRGRTTIVITHEFSHIRDEDYVVMVENGTIVKEGLYGDLGEQFSHRAAAEITNEKLPNSDKSGKRFSKFDLLKNHPILKDLENSTVSGPEPQTPVMGIFAILNYCRSTIDNKILICIGLFVSLIQGAANPVFSFCFSKLLSTMVRASVGIDVSGDLTKWSCVVIGISATIGISQFVSQFILEYASENWVVNLRKEAFAKINEQDMSFFSKQNNPAELTALLMNDTRDLRNLVSGFLILAINLVSMVIVGIVWSIVTGWKLSLVGIAMVPVIIGVTAVYGKLLKGSESTYKSKIADLENHNHETVTGIRTILCMNMKQHFLDDFELAMKQVTKVGHVRAVHTGFGLALSELCTACATATILFYGMTLVAHGEYSQEQLLQVITLLTFTLASAGGLITQLPHITRGQRAGTYIINILKLKPSPAETEGHIIPRPKQTWSLKFENLKFAYPNRPTEYILRGISFSLAKNETLAILGESGCGKSTIVKLLTKLYGSNDRCIFYSGMDLNQLDLEWLRAKISIVPQFPKFFMGTIHENLVYGLTRKCIDEIYSVLKLVNIYEFVISLPEGISTLIGEGSNSLISGGQLQRLSIARALLRNPQILILDECTSSLDPENKKIIREVIETLSKRCSILMVTHDKEMMKISHRALVLKNGYIVEEGTYEDLIEKRGELWRISGESKHAVGV